MKSESNKKLNWVNLFETPWTSMSMGLGIRDYEAGNPYKSLAGCRNNYVLYYGTGTGVTAYHLREELDASAEWGLAAHRDKKVMKKYLADAHGLTKKIHKFVAEMESKDIGILTNKQLFTLLKNNFDLLQASFAYYKLCNDEYQVGVGKLFDQDILQELAMPTEHTTTDQFEIALYKLALDMKKNKYDLKKLPKAFINKVAKIAKKYGPIGSGSEGGKVWDVDAVMYEISEKNKLSVAALQKAFDALVNKNKIGQTKKANLIKKHNVSEELVRFASQLAALAHTKYELRIGWAYLDPITRNLFTRLSSLFDYPLDDIKYLLKDEIIQTLNSAQGSNLPRDIAARKKASLFLIDNGIYSVYFGHDAMKIFEEQIGYKENHATTAGQDEKTKVDFIKGLVASKGKAIGRVTIVSPLKYQEEELSKVKEGDVLVTGMTRPHMLPAMKRAVAFVTDEGGITCHAAIIAREMKKPCVVATRIGTKVLKDGDMVEVDAEKGIVKIIK